MNANIASSNEYHGIEYCNQLLEAGIQWNIWETDKIMFTKW